MNLAIFARNKLGYIHVLSILFFIVIMLQFISLYQFSIFYNFLAVLLYLIFGIVLLKSNPLLFSMLFLFYFGQGWAIFANFFLEKGFFIIEQNRWSYATGSTIRLTIYNMFLLICSSIIYKNIFINNKQINVKSPMWEKTIILISIIGLLILLCFSIKIFNAPLLLNIDRFSYWSNHPFLLLRTFVGQLIPLSFLLGIIYIQSHNKITKNIVLILLIFIILLFILFGEKFTGIFHSIYFFLLPYFVDKFSKDNKASVLKTITLFIIILLLISPVISYHYIDIYGGSSIIDKIIERVILQGHVWWGIDEIVSHGNGFSTKQLKNEIGSWFNISPDINNIGMRFLMKNVAPEKIANAYIERGVNFTMGYPAIGLYLFGYYGLFIGQLLASVIIILSLRYLYNKIIKRQLILGLLAIKIFIEIYGSLTMGNYFNIFSIKMIFYILMITYFETIFISSRRKNVVK